MSEACFADTYFYVALARTGDAGHADTRAFAERFKGQIVTTQWVLSEVGASLASPSERPTFISLVEHAELSRRTEVIEASSTQFSAGLDLYRQRPDKAWSLVDCISFAVMTGRGLTDALTADRHFEQAGFNAVLG